MCICSSQSNLINTDHAPIVTLLGTALNLNVLGGKAYRELNIKNQITTKSRHLKTYGIWLQPRIIPSMDP
ncbi:hypothetical protein PC119_g25886 [Phytophthora cactorum]|nr:hypothetical protein PC119_g25886 [Phytophthora cactorum]